MDNVSFTGLIELKKRFLFLVLALSIYRFGSYLPVPGLDSYVIKSILNDVISEFGFLGVFNLFSGGSLGRMTIFSLNVMPYIVSSIVVQLLFASFKKDDDKNDPKTTSFYCKLLTILVTIFQSFMVIKGLEKLNLSYNFMLYDSFLFYAVAIPTFIGSTLFLIWLGEQINVRGLGNGISLIIFAGIVAELPYGVYKMFSSFSMMNIFNAILLFCLVLVIFFFLLYIIVLFERSYRCVNIQHPKNYHHSMRMQKLSDNSYIPIKINISGVIPAIFSNAIVLFPLTIANFNRQTVWGEFLIQNLSLGSFGYIFLYCICIVFFCFFYMSFVFNVDDVASSLKRGSCIVAGKRPGKVTADYLRYIANRITVVGAVYLAFISVAPEIFRHYYYVPFTIGGTSLLIVVSVILELITQVQGYMFTARYDSYMKRFKVKR